MEHRSRGRPEQSSNPAKRYAPDQPGPQGASVPGLCEDSMLCRYCQAVNEPEERRCVRCGRRLYLAAARPAPNDYVATSTALALECVPGRAPVPSLENAPPERVSYQPPLFRDVSNGPKVIPIPMLTPVKPRAREDSSQVKRRRTANPKSASSRRGSDAQQSLNFHAEEAARSLNTEVQAVIYCDAPVASPTHRLLAAAIDASLIVTAVGLFLAIFFISGGVLAFSKQNLPFFLGVAVLITAFYRSLWYLAGGDSPGMRFAGLHLVDFDGRRPDRDQRGMRQIASLLSVVSAGLGLVWALVDEESLTWHDHISKTFPTAG